MTTNTALKRHACEKDVHLILLNVHLQCTLNLKKAVLEDNINEIKGHLKVLKLDF